MSNSNPESVTSGGASDISAKELINTHGSGEPSADNVDVQSDSQKADASSKDSDSTSNPSGGASDISAKELINTHGSGEPSADNVDVQSDSQKG